MRVFVVSTYPILKALSVTAEFALVELSLMLKSLPQWQIESIDYWELEIGVWQRASLGLRSLMRKSFLWGKTAPLYHSEQGGLTLSFGGQC